MVILNSDQLSLLLFKSHRWSAEEKSWRPPESWHWASPRNKWLPAGSCTPLVEYKFTHPSTLPSSTPMTFPHPQPHPPVLHKSLHHNHHSHSLFFSPLSFNKTLQQSLDIWSFAESQGKNLSYLVQNNYSHDIYFEGLLNNKRFSKSGDIDMTSLWDIQVTDK